LTEPTIITDTSPFVGEVTRMRGALGMDTWWIVAVVIFTGVVVVDDGVVVVVVINGVVVVVDNVVVVVVVDPGDSPEPSENDLEAVMDGAPVSLAVTVNE